VIGFTSPYFWYSTRVTGFVALILLTVVLVMGILISTRVGGRRVGRFEINELHRALSMTAMIFVGIHIVATVVDTYVPTGWISALIPFTSPYKSLDISIGTVAFDLMLAVWLTSLVKERIEPRVWRAIHWASYASFVAAATHAFVIGTDHRTHWGLAVLAGCVAVAALATVWRILGRPTRAAGRTALSPLQGPSKGSR